MNKFTLFFLLISFFTFAQKSEMKKQVSAITAGKNATIGVSVKGINFPFEFNNENAKKKQPTLSVYKFHIAVAVLDFVDQGKLSLDQKILVKKSDLLENTWSPIRKKYPEGNIEMPLSELIVYTVAHSDNNGCDMLLRLIGGTDTVQKFMDSKKVRDYQIKYTEEEMHRGAQFIYPNHTTAKSMSKLLSDFQKGKILSKSSIDFLIKTMLETSTGLNKLMEQLPENSVAHKTGSSGTNENGFTIADNDTGIVTLPDGRKYAITVFVSDSREKPAVNTKMISDISKTVWDLLVK